MTHMTIEYPMGTEGDIRALADLREWIGEKAFTTLHLLTRDQALAGVDKDGLREFLLNTVEAFHGVSGRPLAALGKQIDQWWTEAHEPM